jgi:molybdopterin molybdotransferase/putative molybdopterin biosynthesis protein
MATNTKTLRSARDARGFTQLELARCAGISRQALGAIESGLYMPSVSVALSLARELGQSVETLFGDGGQATSNRIEVDWSTDEAGGRNAFPCRVALARVGGQMVAVRQPTAQLMLPAAAGMLERTQRSRAEVETFRTPEEIDSTLLIAGCDPAVTILTDWLARHRAPVSAIALPCSSSRALSMLMAGRTHAAGVHLKDRDSDEYNLAPARTALGRHPATVFGFARWELGLATAVGNRLGIRQVADLARRGVRLVNREVGAGARAFLDEALAESGIDAKRIDGYDFEVGGHLEVAAAIASGHANVGVTIRLAADTYRLPFVPIREERYDLVILDRDLDSTPVKAMLEALNSRRFAREVSQFCAYDTSQMGDTIARVA